MMESRSYIFDLVILYVSVNDFDNENNELTVDVCFNDTEFTIEQNPDQAGEFKQGRTCEFEAYPDELKNDLLDNPLKLTVKDIRAVNLGEATISWPKEMLQKIENEHFAQYGNFENCDLMTEQKATGKIGIQYRLRAKCELPNVPDGDGRKRCDIQNELKRIVKPNDLFFILQNDSGSDILRDMKTGAKSKWSCPTALDLSQFKDFHGKIITDPGLFDQVYSLDCCHTQKFPLSSGKPMTPPVSFFSLSGKNLPKKDDSKSSTQWACNATQHVRECPHSNKFSDETIGSCSCDCVRQDPHKKKDVFVNGRIKNICHYPTSPPVLKETVYVRPKLCPVCGNNVSWLPKLAACPKCGHKPTPYAIEKPYNENLTADQILQEWANENEKTEIPKRTKRCTCKNGKICAYCRIRKLCKDVLKTKKCRHSNARASTDSGVTLKDMSIDNICKSTSETENRPYLAKVFSELRDLYNLRTEKIDRIEKFVLDPKCENILKPKYPAESKAKCRIPESAVNKKEALTKELAPERKAKWCKGKLYNYKTVRKYPTTLIGHKDCVCSGKYVPKNMGWLWNTDTSGARRGWKPGAIRKPIKEIMKYFLKDFPVDSLRVSRYARKSVVAKNSEELVQKPTLQVVKKGGVYTIIMRPLKNATLLKKCADPYMAMQPICFKIIKNPLRVHESQMKKELKKLFHKCRCHKPVSHCYCRTYLDKKRLEFELNKACRQKGIPNLKESLVLTDTSESEDEFDFGVTPPAGIIKPHLKNQPDLVCRETQYSKADYILKPTFPMPMNKYMKPIDITGGRTLPTGDDGVGWGTGQVCGHGNYGGSRGGLRGGRGGRAGYRGGRIPRGPISAAERGPFGGAAGGGGPGGGAGGVSGNTMGGVGGWGGVGGNSGAGRVQNITGATEKTRPLFCELARRRKAEPICPPQFMSCIPTC